MEKPEIIGIAPQLLVKDVVKTAQYYHDILGFEIIGFFGEPEVYAMVSRDGFQIHFAKSENPNPPNHTIHSISVDFILWIPDIQSFYKEVTAKGARIIEGLTKRIYGSTEFIIEDCDGHRIRIGD